MEKVLEDGEEPDPDAGISVADDLLQQAIEESKAMAEAGVCWFTKGVMDADPKFNPKLQVRKFVIGTNLADFAR